MAQRNASIRGEQIKDAFFGAALIRNSGDNNIMDINVDDSSIEVATDALNVKALGITNAMLAGSITAAKLVDDYIITTEVDDTTIEFSGGTLNVVANGIGAAELDETDTYDFTSGTVRVATPVGTTDATPKSYVDGLVNGLDWKNSVRIATVSSIADLSDYTVADQEGVTLVEGDRILVKDTASIDGVEGLDAKRNGIYVVGTVTTGTAPLTRAEDANVDAEVTSGLATFVEEGTVNVDRGYTLTTNDPITLDTTGLTFTQFTGLGAITAGVGLTKTGDTIDLDLDTLSAVAVDVANDDIAIADSSDSGNTKKESIADLITAVAGDALVATSGVLDVQAGTGLEISSDTVRIAAAAAGVGLSGGAGSALAVDLNELSTEATFDVTADFIGIVDASDSGSDKTLWSVIATAIAGTGITATNGVLSADTVSDVITESDFVKSVQTATGGQTVMTTFSGSADVVPNASKVYLNGLLQEEGGSEDYTIVNTTGVVTFVVGLDAGDVVTLTGVLDN